MSWSSALRSRPWRRGYCHGLARLVHLPITTHSFTWVLIAHTCTSSAPSSACILKHTPHMSPLSDLVSFEVDWCYYSKLPVYLPWYSTYLLSHLQHVPPSSTPLSVFPRISTSVSPLSRIVRCVLRSPYPRVPVRARELPLSPSLYYCACSLY